MYAHLRHICISLTYECLMQICTWVHAYMLEIFKMFRNYFFFQEITISSEVALSAYDNYVTMNIWQQCPKEHMTTMSQCADDNYVPMNIQWLCPNEHVTIMSQWMCQTKSWYFQTCTVWKPISWNTHPAFITFLKWTVIFINCVHWCLLSSRKNWCKLSHLCNQLSESPA